MVLLHVELRFGFIGEREDPHAVINAFNVILDKLEPLLLVAISEIRWI